MKPSSYTGDMLHLSMIIFRDGKGRILLQFRDSAASSDPLVWSFFGGLAEEGETPLEAVIREVKEELDLDISFSDVRLLLERRWISPHSHTEKMVHFFEGMQPISWKDVCVKEGAGAAFLKKEEVARLAGVSLLAKTFIEDYCT